MPGESRDEGFASMKVQNPDSLDIRDIVLLLNYKRLTTDPRFRNAKLLELKDDLSFEKKPPYWQNKESEGKAIRGFLFDTDSSITSEDVRDVPGNMLPDGVSLKKLMSPSVSSLPSAVLETIYHETRNHDGCYRSIQLLQAFFKHYPSDHPVHIRMPSGEVIDSVVDLAAVVEYAVLKPNQLSFSVVLSKVASYLTGGDVFSKHAVWGFSSLRQDYWAAFSVPPAEARFDCLVDMSCMQFGSVGRGARGETFSITTMDGEIDMLKKAAEEARIIKVTKGIGPPPVQDAAWLEGIVKRAKARWDNRATERWCRYCGAPSPPKKRCSCKQESYCSKEHQDKAWKFHKRFCSYKSKAKSAA